MGFRICTSHGNTETYVEPQCQVYWISQLARLDRDLRDCATVMGIGRSELEEMALGLVGLLLGLRLING